MISVLYLYVCVAMTAGECSAYEPYRKLVTITGPDAPQLCEAMVERFTPQIPEAARGEVFLGCETSSAERNDAVPAPRTIDEAKLLETTWI